MAITEGLHILSAAKVRAESVIASVEAPPLLCSLGLRLSNGLVEALLMELLELLPQPGPDSPHHTLQEVFLVLFTFVQLKKIKVQSSRNVLLVFPRSVPGWSSSASVLTPHIISCSSPSLESRWRWSPESSWAL